MRIPLIDMAWDDRRHSFRAPMVEPRLSVPQRYFRVALLGLGVGVVAWLGAFVYLIALAVKAA